MKLITTMLHNVSPRLRLVLLCLLGVWLTLVIIVAFQWPFTRAKLIRDLEHFSSSDVKVGRVRQIFFPNPGYVAEDLRFLRTSSGQQIQLASVQRVSCRASWISLLLFQHRIKDMQLEGLRVLIPRSVPAAVPHYPEMKDRTTVSTLIANGALLDIDSRHAGGRSLRFDFSKLILREVKKEKSISLETALHLSWPPANLSVKGRFGPFIKGQIGQTPLWGDYHLALLDLGQFDGIAGKLSSDGSFRGTLAQCALGAKTHIDDFELTSIRHPVKLYGEFESTLNGLTGNVAIRSTRVHFLQTGLRAAGTIQTVGQEHGKTESLEISSDKARIEDLLWLFAKSEPPALCGPIGLEASIVLPPGPQQFLQKLQLKGSFRIPKAEFLHRTTQENVNKLSNRARGHKPNDAELEAERIPSSFDARVVTRSGTATLSQATFGTAGATASGGGTYNLLTQAIDLRGKLKIEASLSKAAGGAKSIFLIPLDPFFKKEHAGAVLPIHVTGTYEHPVFRVVLTGRK